MISTILGEMKLSDFVEEYLEKKILIQRGVSKLGDEFGLDDFDQYLLQHEGNLQEKARVTYDGQPIVLPAYVGLHEAQRTWVLNWFKKGATVKLEELEIRHPYFIDLCSYLGRVFNGNAYAKPFLTGPAHKGLNVHFDTSEVFVVQLKGTKKWKIWERVVNNPTPVMQYVLSEEELGQPALEIMLDEGDVLYLPSGTPHSATSQDEYSLHMGLGIDVTKMFDVLSAYVKMSSEDSVLIRTSIFPHSDPESLQVAFERVMQGIIDRKFGSVLESYYISKNATSRNLSNQAFSSAVNAHKINEHSKVKITLGQSLKSRLGDGVVNVYSGATLAPGNSLALNPTAIEFPEYCNEEIAYIIAHGNDSSLVIKDIPGKLDAESKVVLCTSLIEAGALILSSK